jgi:hypothetical protein
MAELMKMTLECQKQPTWTARADQDVGAPGRLIIWCPFKLIFFKYLFKIHLVGKGENYFYFASYARSHV